jgi:hypothetical protein
VNSTLSPQHELNFQRPSRLLTGIVLSVALHAALLLAWRQGKQAPPAETAPSRPIAVWLRPPPAQVEPAPRVEPAPAPAVRARPDQARTAKPRHRAPPNVIALPAPPPSAVPAPPDAFTVEPAEPSAPRFDADAARRMARELANAPDPAKAGSAVAQLPPKPLAADTRAARAISQAKRRDCKDGIPGGLLAPLYLMMDKKDSGCKW